MTPEERKEYNRKYYAQRKAQKNGTNVFSFDREGSEPSLSSRQKDSNSVLDNVQYSESSELRKNVHSNNVDKTSEFETKVDLIKAAFLFCLVAGLTAYLVSEATSVLSSAGQRWPLGFSILLELSIVALATVRPEGKVSRFGFRLLLILVSCYSLAVIDLGIERSVSLEKSRLQSLESQEKILLKDIAEKEKELSLLVEAKYLGASRKLSERLETSKTAYLGVVRSREAVSVIPDRSRLLLTGGRAILVVLNACFAAIGSAIVRRSFSRISSFPLIKGFGDCAGS